MPRLENWRIIDYGNFKIAWGNCYDDEKGRFRNGDYIRTSVILSFNPEARTIQTRNTLYKLGIKSEADKTIDPAIFHGMNGPEGWKQYDPEGFD